MSVHCPLRREPRAARQRGQAMLLTVLLLGVGVSAVIYNFVTPTKESIGRDKITTAALAQARDALVGRAAADNNRPGSLPCPDIDNDGALTMGVDYGGGGNCLSNIGRLPWRTLGLPDLRDGSGERLWYGVSPNFQDSSGVSINSDTPGQLTINGGPNPVIAIVFAPGPVLGNQQRDTGSQNAVANYLEGGNQNGGATNAYFASAAGAFNDKLTSITRETLLPVVEMRIAREIRLSLRNYFSSPVGTPRQYYPFAAQLPSNIAKSGIHSGYVPTSVGCSVLLPDLALPSWFTANSWQQFLVYAVAPQCTPKLNTNPQLLLDTEPTPPCALQPCPSSGLRTCQIIVSIDPIGSNCNNTTAGGLLTVSGDATVKAVVMPASYRLGAQVRPCTAITDCLEAVGGSNENINSDNVYVRPVRSATNNDSLVVVDPSP